MKPRLYWRDRKKKKLKLKGVTVGGCKGVWGHGGWCVRGWRGYKKKKVQHAKECERKGGTYTGRAKGQLALPNEGGGREIFPHRKGSEEENRGRWNNTKGGRSGSKPEFRAKREKNARPGTMRRGRSQWCNRMRGRLRGNEMYKARRRKKGRSGGGGGGSVGRGTL